MTITYSTDNPTSDHPGNSSASSITASVEEPNKKDIKVKVFYTFQGIDSTCLCTFLSSVDQSNETEFLPVSLKECLMALCASCPDMLLYPEADCAVYSASFEETHSSSSSSSGIVWEGHGLLSWLLDGEASVQVNGKYIDNQHVEVVLQLHPVRIYILSIYYYLFKNQLTQLFNFFHHHNHYYSCLKFHFSLHIYLFFLLPIIIHTYPLSFLLLYPYLTDRLMSIMDRNDNDDGIFIYIKPSSCMFVVNGSNAFFKTHYFNINIFLTNLLYLWILYVYFLFFLFLIYRRIAYQKRIIIIH
ncbi:hypothetical protein BDC45DRAFT_47483 [Circinella umbellata]|nr:hypothetical protein BDC45DRAFT_47483 [Circinella umbellata]